LSNIAQLFLLTKVKQISRYIVIVYYFFEEKTFDYLHTHEMHWR